MTDSVRENVKELFMQADTNGDGLLEAKELELILEDLGMSKSAVNKVIVEADKNKNGKLSLDEFIAWCFDGSPAFGTKHPLAEGEYELWAPLSNRSTELLGINADGTLKAKGDGRDTLFYLKHHGCYDEKPLYLIQSVDKQHRQGNLLYLREDKCLEAKSGMETAQIQDNNSHFVIERSGNQHNGQALYNIYNVDGNHCPNSFWHIASDGSVFPHDNMRDELRNNLNRQFLFKRDLQQRASSAVPAPSLTAKNVTSMIFTVKDGGSDYASCSGSYELAESAGKINGMPLYINKSSYRVCYWENKQWGLSQLQGFLDMVQLGSSQINVGAWHWSSTTTDGPHQVEWENYTVVRHEETKEVRSNPELEVYTRAASITSSLEKGDDGEIAINFVCSDYIDELDKQGSVLVRRQDLPTNAIQSQRGVKEQLDRIEMWFEEAAVLLQFMFILSYRWLSREHPDPHRHHLKAVSAYLRSVRKTTSVPLALFWDFLSIFQNPRTPQQQKAFVRGLKFCNVLYGHTLTTIIVQRSIPDGFEGATYDESGWCTFEVTVGGIAKSKDAFIDLANLAFTGLAKLTNDAIINASVHVELFPPPIAPDKFNDILDKLAFTNGKTDRDVVKDMYRRTFEVISRSAEDLQFGMMQWNAAQCKEFINVLPVFTACRQLFAEYNNFGDEGVAQLLHQLVKLPSLESVQLYNTGAGEKALAALAEVLPKLPHLNTVSIQYKNPCHDKVDAKKLHGIRAAAGLQEVTFR